VANDHQLPGECERGFNETYVGRRNDGRSGRGTSLMTSNYPTISIITVCLNSERYIRDTLESVRNQTRRPGEFIVIDGGSTDRTNAIVEEYPDVVTEHVSEPDRGIADAMNKGVQLSTGDYLMFLHSDDFLVDRGVIERVEGALDRRCSIHGFVVVFRSGVEEILIRPRNFGFRMNFKIPFCHQGVLCARSLFEELGSFDESFKICMDYDFFLRAYRNGHTERRHDFPIAVMRDTGISSRRDWSGLSARFAEERRVHRKNVDSAWLKMLYPLYWALYLPYRRARNQLRAKPA
jgi:glycosyltransferase involved in cell wall biosynthesis